MARRAKESDHGAEQKENQITEALERKRRQLDHEIAEFKAGKEQEYRDFEKRLRGKSKGNGMQDASKSQSKRGRSSKKSATAEAGHTEKEEAKYVQRESDDENPGQKGPGPKGEDLIITARLKSSPGVSPGSPDRSTETLHEREKDFQGPFTPSYFPPVGNTSVDESCRSKELLQTPSFNSGDLSPARHNNGAMLSSSAETVHPLMTSPPLPPTRPLSSSVPPEKPSHHRRDSSRSDTSIASLRSSLRDPKQPRSPKRVLFSIDDTLVSPSTSPIAQRSKSMIHTKLADLAEAIGGFEKFEVIRNRNGNDPAGNRSPSNGLGFLSSSTPLNGWTASLPAFGRGTRSNVLEHSFSAGGPDDFEHLESDDLFTFDEHMGRTDKNKPQDRDLEDDYDEGNEVEDRNKDPLTASSPHAGSLPIEIKWPGRREGRG